MQLAPIADNGFRGAAKSIDPGRASVEWLPWELPAGRYDRVALIEQERETIEFLRPTPIDLDGRVTSLVLWL